MPFPCFEEDENLYSMQRFCESCAEKGLFFHPHHNWFLSNAHDTESIDQAIAVADKALEQMSAEDDS